MNRKKALTFAMVGLLFFIALMNPADGAEIITKEIIEKLKFTQIDFFKAADNFVVLFDSSSSMNKKFPGTDKTMLALAKELLKQRNSLLPDLGYNAGLYLYTPYKAVYSMQRYDRQRFAAAIDQLPDKGSGPTLLRQGLVELRKIMSGLTGRTAVFLFTDGGYDPTIGLKRPSVIASEIASDHDVCFYVISTATGEARKKVVKAVANVRACSRVVPIEALYNRPEHISGALFDVKATSRVKYRARDKVVGFKLDNILFGFDQATIEPEYTQVLDNVGKLLDITPKAYVSIDGYTDNVGGREYNDALSRRRAESVATYLMDKFNIDSSRIVNNWYGMLNPVGDNATREGRRRNRRVEISIGGL